MGRHSRRPVPDAARLNQDDQPRACQGPRAEHSTSALAPLRTISNLDGVTTHGTTHDGVQSVGSEDAEVAIAVDHRYPAHIVLQHLAEGGPERGPDGNLDLEWDKVILHRSGQARVEIDPAMQVRVGVHDHGPSAVRPPTIARTSSIDRSGLT